MTPDKWQEIKNKLQGAFKDVEISQEELAEPDRGSIEILEFIGPMGRMRLEYTTKPLIIDKQVSGSRRIGSHHEVKYIFSDTEISHIFKAYKWDEEQDDWVEFDLKNSFTL
ncbi:MAG: hypothetical protein WCT26_04305 [Candidatus Buchananbacteria bacterium]|jgi:hypothetical protein